jgi:hypothetical protein
MLDTEDPTSPVCVAEAMKLLRDMANKPSATERILSESRGDYMYAVLPPQAPLNRSLTDA